MNHMHMEKIKLIDRLFEMTSVEQLVGMVEEAEVVSKLQGNILAPPVLTELVYEHNRMNTDLMRLHTDMANIRADITVILRGLRNPQDPSTAAGFSAMNARYGIY